MKKRILSFILCLVAVAGIIFTPISAFAATDNTDYLLKEISTNIPDFYPGKYPADPKGSPMILGSTIYDVYESYIPGSGYDGTIYSVYVYNPSGLTISHCLGYLELAAYFNGDTCPNDFTGNEQLFYKDDVSRDGLFYKFSVKLYIPRRDDVQQDLSFDLSYLDIILKNGESWYLDQRHVSSFSWTPNGYNVNINSVGKKSLDVNLTSYKVGTVGTDLTTRYEIFTAYFGIPEQYINYYSNLYSVTAEYLKKLTNPIIWSDDPLTSAYFYTLPHTGPDFILPAGGPYFLSPGFSWSLVSSLEFSYGYNLISARTAVNAINNNGYKYNVEHFYGSSNVLGVVSSSDDLSYDYLVEFLEGYNFEDPDKLIYAGVEKVINTKVIDDSFDVLDYYDSASWLDYWNDYGADVGLMMLALEYPDIFGYLAGSSVSPVAGLLGLLNPEKVEEILLGFIDLEESREHLEDVSNIVILTDKDREFIATASVSDVSSKYLIDQDDVTAFKQYVASNPYTVLYRYDVCESYTDELVKVDSTLKRDGSYTYKIAQRFHFVDFNVINLTFDVNSQYLSICTRSDKKNYTPGLSVDNKPTGPSINTDNGFDNIRDMFDQGFDDTSNKINDLLDRVGNLVGQIGAGFVEITGSFGSGFFDGFFDQLLGESSKIIKPILIVLGVALLLFLIWWVISSITGKNFFDVFIEGGGLAVKVSEMKVKRADSDTRRRDAEADARIRSEQNAIRKRELSIDEKIADKKVENESRRNDIRERDVNGKIVNQARRNDLYELDVNGKIVNQSRRNDLYDRDVEGKIVNQTRRNDLYERKVVLKEVDQARRHAKEDAFENKKQNAKYNNFSTEDALEANMKRTYGNKK